MPCPYKLMLLSVLCTLYSVICYLSSAICIKSPHRNPQGGALPFLGDFTIIVNNRSSGLHIGFSTLEQNLLAVYYVHAAGQHLCYLATLHVVDAFGCGPPGLLCLDGVNGGGIVVLS